MFLRTLFPLLLVASMAPRTGDDIDLKYTPKVGDKQKLGMVMTMSAMSMKVSMHIATEVTSVEDGKTTVKGTTTGFAMEMNGQPFDPPGGAPPETHSTTIYDATGKVVSYETDSQMGDSPRTRRLSAFQYPTTKVKEGDSWTYDWPADKDKDLVAGKSKYTLEGTDTFKGATVYKVKFVYSETEGDQPFGSTGTILLDKDRNRLMKLVADYENVKFVDQMPPTSAHVELVSED